MSERDRTMSDNSNVTQSVASGNSPQPTADIAKASNYDAAAQEVENSIDATDEDEGSYNDGSEQVAETKQNAAASIDDAQKKGDISKKEAEILKKKLKLKVDGQEFEEEIDFSDDENLKKHLQKSKAFDKRVQEFQSYKSQVDQLLKMLEEDPEALLEKMGKNVDEMAEKRLTRKVEELKKSPEQLEREKMEQELQELRDEKKKLQSQKESEELERMRNEAAQKIETDISEALDSVKSILPKKNPLVLQRVTQTMLMAMKKGFNNVTAKDVIPLVEKQWKQELSDFFNVLPEDTIEMLVGKQNLDRVRNKRIQSKRAATMTANQIVKESSPGTKREEPEDGKPKTKRMRDFFRE